nr:retrovirus-related Pol polyprotein from transposon TNT 1-94 [Tanacetum cinerariifolium]
MALADDELSMGKNHARNDWVERYIPNRKLPNFNIGRILVLKSQAVIECSKPTKAANDPKTSKDFESKSLTSLSPLKISRELLQALRILYFMKYKKKVHKTSNHDMYVASLKRSENYKAKPYQYASPSIQILKVKEKPFPPCTHYGFNDHRPDDCRNYLKCEICRSYDHFTSRHNRVILVRGGVLAKYSVGVRCNTCGSIAHSTTDHNDFDHFKKGEKIQASKAREPTKKMVENQNDIKVKHIRTDNETEYRNSKLESFYDEKGISHNFSSPYTPEQNGVAERKKITIIEDRWLIDQNIKLVNIIGDPCEGMLTRSMAAKLTAASASECLFTDFLSEIEPKKVSEALKYPRWVDAMQEELNQFYRNKVWTLGPVIYEKMYIGFKWVFRNKKDEHRIITKNKARLVA